MRLDENLLPVEVTSDSTEVVLEISASHIEAFVDGKKIVCGKDPTGQSPAGWLWFNLNGDAEIRRIEVLGEAEEKMRPCHPSRKREDFQLEVCVDFFDDLISAPFSRETFDNFFVELKTWGVTRCHWIYYGGRENGWWDFGPLGVAGHAAETFENVGDIFKAAVDAAHAHGIEIFGLIKPFDIGCDCYKRGGRESGNARVEGIGGGSSWVVHFVAEHPELLMARRPDAWGEAVNETFTRIDLVKEDDADCSFGVDDIELYVSEDNVSYEKYMGPVARTEQIEDYPVYVHKPSGVHRTDETRRTRILRLDGLAITSKYMAVTVPGREGSFRNKLYDLVHVFGERGEERMITVGYELVEGDGGFQSRGIVFDHVPGTPTALFPAFEPIEAPFALDEGEGVLAIARGKERSPFAAMSPSFPEARKYWLSWVQDVLDAGADGVELRVRNHHSPLSWTEYGFEPPVVEEFRRRYGVDLLTADVFDRALHRRLRGEGYTEFVREASALVRSHGKRLGLHIASTMNVEPEEGAAMDIHWDWRTWIDEGLADSVTMKEVWPRTSFAEEILGHTRKQGIPVIFSPFNSFWLGPHHLATIRAEMNAAKAGGYDGLQWYESDSLLTAEEGGRVNMAQPALRDVFRKAVGMAPYQEG